MNTGVNGETLCQALIKKLGAWRCFVLTLDAGELLNALELRGDELMASTLGGLPLCCADVRGLGRQARTEGRALVVDNTVASYAACAAVRLGAHVAYEQLGEGALLVGVSKDVGRVLPEAVGRLESMPTPDDAVCAQLEASMPGHMLAWRTRSDAAQVVASYLVCHPRVDVVRYPGLKHDPCFAVAARTLEGGFGPYVDFRPTGAPEYERYVATTEDAKAQVLTLEHAL